VKKFLISVAVLACLGSTAYAADDEEPPPPTSVIPLPLKHPVPPPMAPAALGWVYLPYTICSDPPRCSMGIVNVQADELTVRLTPNGPATMALVNGTPLIPIRQQGNWLLVTAACDLTPTFAWSWTAGAPLNRC
jgi:hypothetical protein